MELSLQQRRKALTTKIPDIQQTLSVVKYLQLRRKKAAGEAIEEETADDDDEDDLDDLDEEEEEGEKKDENLKTLFELNDTLYAEAEVEETGEVGLWLGVSVYCPLAARARFRIPLVIAGIKKYREEAKDVCAGIVLNRPPWRSGRGYGCSVVDNWTNAD